MSVQTNSWGSRLMAAHSRGDVTSAELWHLLLAHVDHPQADDLIDRLLVRFRGLLDGSQAGVQVVEDELFILGEEERELLAG